ncbi:MAG TPA: hypothetical protein VE969_04725, partial [Pyrinomonadaceae bacterium]|nr:hypothetical protein [Pyrinomonadaceae bacterium]
DDEFRCASIKEPTGVTLNLLYAANGLSQDRLQPGFDQSLSYHATQFDFAIFKPLTFDEERGAFLLPAIAQNHIAFIELTPATTARTYSSTTGIELLDRDTMKIVKTADGTKYLFVRYPDDEFRCASIKEATGATLNLLYTANGLSLHGLVDSTGRSVTFNYGKQGIESLTQTWMSNLEGFTKTWGISEANPDDGAKYAHAVRAGKFLPSNALIHDYTAEMEQSDKLLAQIFGGPNAVVGANGFEPAGLAAAYPLYRGDVMGDDGKVRRGHLSYAMHIYGSADGRGDSPLYVPAGFTSHSSEPSPTDAAVMFYYPRLGNLTDVTLAVFHVADFQLSPEGERVRIGNLGGPGGSSALYKHSHIEFYRGNVGLPAAAARAALRIDPTTVFSR